MVVGVGSCTECRYGFNQQLCELGRLTCKNITGDEKPRLREN